MGFTLHQLEYFVAVAEAGKLNAAAERCHVSQAGIALAMTELERSLGVQLLVRRKAKGVALTPAGQRLVADARALLGQADELQAAAQAAGGELSGSLRAGCFTSLAPMLVPPLLDTFAAGHPALRLEFVEDTHAMLQRLLLDGAIEVALLYDRDLHPDVQRRMIRTLKPYVLLAADHPCAGKERVSLRELAGDHLIRVDLPPFVHSSLHEFAQVPVRYQTGNPELVRCLVGRGLGFALLVQRSPTDLTYEGRRVVALPLADDLPDVSIVLAYPRGARLTRRAEALAEFCMAIPH
jgi:DNA-binding transcriptional LysR family regulator